MNTNLCLSLSLLALLPAGVRAQAPPQPSPSPSPGAAPSFPAQVELVVVDAVVKDKKGAPVTDLRQGDFSVLEDGQAQSIVSFEAIELPDAPQPTPLAKPRVSSNTSREAQTGRTFVIVFDDIHLSPFQARRAKIAVAEFLKTGVREGDRVTLAATGGGAWWSTRMEAGREELLTLLKRLDGRQIPDRAPDRITDYEAMRIQVYRDQEVVQRVSRRFEAYGVGMSQGARRDSTSAAYGDADPLVSGRAQEVYYQAASRSRITLGIVDRVLQSLATTRGRKSMILVSEGFIFDPNLDEFKQVVQASRRANVAIYFLNTKGLEGGFDFQGAEYGPPLPEQDIGATFGDALEAAAGAESIASDSGGFVVRNTNDLGRGIQRIADDSRSYYLLGYVPQNAKRDGRFRKIELKVNRKGLEVRARKGYFAPLEGAKAAEKKPGTDPDIQAALDSPFEEPDIPMRLTAHVFDETLLGKAAAVVTAEVDVSQFGFDEREGRLVDTLEFLLVVAHRDTGEYLRYDQKVDMKLLPATKDRLDKTWFPLSRDFELAPGAYQAKLVVRDQNNGRIGTVMHDFEVADLAQLRTSSLLLTDTLQAPAEASKDGKPAPPRLAIVARRSFSIGARLFASFEVYGAAKDKATSMPRVSSGYVVRRSDGLVIAEQPSSVITPTSLGKLSRMVGFSLEGAPVGEYEMVLSLKDEVSGKDLEIKEPFTVVQGQ